VVDAVLEREHVLAVDGDGLPGVERQHASVRVAWRPQS